MTKQNQYALNEVQIEQLAVERTQSLGMLDTHDGTYLRALITAMQAKLGPRRGKRPATNVQIEALESIAVPFYAAVMRGVMTPEIAIDGTLEAAELRKRTAERNRRATFARTAKSTLVQWVMEGGDARAIDVPTVTKGELRASVAAARTDRGETAASRVERAQHAILTAVAREGPEEQREHLERVIAALQAALAELPATAVSHGSTTILRAPEAGATFRGHVQRVPRAAARAA
jgi:hypothetical protein